MDRIFIRLLLFQKNNYLIGIIINLLYKLIKTPMDNTLDNQSPIKWEYEFNNPFNNMNNPLFIYSK